jgi:ribosomal protein S15P/S13E
VFVTKRKRLLIYLKNKNNDRYEKLIKELKLKRV